MLSIFHMRFYCFLILSIFVLPACFQTRTTGRSNTTGDSFSKTAPGPQGNGAGYGGFVELVVGKVRLRCQDRANNNVSFTVRCEALAIQNNGSELPPTQIQAGLSLNWENPQILPGQVPPRTQSCRTEGEIQTIQICDFEFDSPPETQVLFNLTSIFEGQSSPNTQTLLLRGFKTLPQNVVGFDSFPTNGGVSGVSVDGTNLYVATYAGLAVSNNSGTTWSTKTAYNGLRDNIVYGVYGSGQTVIAMTNSGWSKSINGGATFQDWNAQECWDTFFDGVHPVVFQGGLSGWTSVYANANEVYVGSQSGLKIYTNHCAQVTTLTMNEMNGLPNQWIRGLYVSGNRLYATVYNSGLYYSDNKGLNWTAMNNGINALYTSGLWVENVNGVDHIYVGSNGGLFVSTNGGTSFTAKTGIGYGIWMSESTLYTANGSYVGVSTDQGTTLSKRFENTQGLHPNVNDVYAKNERILAATETGLSISANSGKSWTTYTSGLPGTNVRNLVVVPATETTSEKIFVGTNNGLALSTNGGINFTRFWNKSNTAGFADDDVRSIAIVSQLIAVGSWGGLSLSIDGGEHFQNLSGLLSDTRVRTVAFHNGVLYVGTHAGGIFYSSNFTSFTPVTKASHGLADNGVLHVFSDNTLLYVATMYGVSQFAFGQGGALTLQHTFRTAQGLGNNITFQVFAKGNSIYVANESGLSISNDGGSHFQNYGAKDGIGATMRGGMYLDGNLLYAASGLSGLFVSTY